MFNGHKDRYGYRIFVEFYEHALVKSILPRTWLAGLGQRYYWWPFYRPSWIPKAIFADVLLDILARTGNDHPSGTSGGGGDAQEDPNRPTLEVQIKTLESDAVNLMLVNLSKTLQADDSSAIKSNIEYLKRSAVVGVPNCANAWAIFSLKWQVWKIFWSKWQVWIFGPNSPVKKEPSHDRKNAIALLDDLKSAMFYRPEPSPLDTIRAVAGELEQVRQKDSPVLKESARELAKAVNANAIAEVRSMAPELAKKLRPGEENRVRLLIAVSLLEHQAAASTIKPIAEKPRAD